MGQTQHNAIIITGHKYPESENCMHKSWCKAVDLFGQLTSPTILTELNGYLSFFVATDGSKEGWEESIEAGRKRRELCDFIDTFAYGDGSCPVTYVDVEYGDFGVKVARTNNRHNAKGMA